MAISKIERAAGRKRVDRTGGRWNPVLSSAGADRGCRDGWTAPVCRRLLLSIPLLLGLSSGCTTHEVEYWPYVKNIMPLSQRAVAVPGDFTKAGRLFQQAQLPHHTARGHFELQTEGLAALTSQLGSPDYVLIGEIWGSGSAQASLASLTGAICEEASLNGGDVVLITESGVLERPYAYSSYGSFYYGCGGRYYGGFGFAPTYTYEGVLRYPHARGLVFRYEPNVEQRRQAMARLPDGQLQQALLELEELSRNEMLSFEEAMQRWDEMVDDLR